MKIIKSNFRYVAYLLLVCFSLTSLFQCSNKTKSLPYLGNHKMTAKEIDGVKIIDTIYYTVPDFQLTNQDSVLITQNDIEGKVYVVDFFFTSCPTTCPIMTASMKRIQKIIGERPDFLMISHTVDPQRDTPEKLKKFSIKNEINTSNWHFLTAENAYIYKLGMDGYYLSMGKHDAAPGGFIHSSHFILMDKKRHIRGMYDGTDAGEVARLADDIKFLLNY